MKTKISNKISEIIKSEKFIFRLNFLNDNYSNLKQELLIRNVILEELNEYFCTENLGHLKAFAEHPRINGSRVDLSIINKQDLKNPILIEFKFQFSKDDNHMVNYHRIIKKDFEDRKSDIFILIIANWNIKNKKEYDNSWNITSNLSRYISKNDDWKLNILASFKEFKNTKLIEFEKLEIDLPYKTDYYLYLLKRK